MIIFASRSLVVLPAESIFLPSLSGGQRLEIIEKENLRRRVDGHYTGYVYREYRGLLSLESREAEGDRYTGSFYLLEDLSKLGVKSRFVEDRVRGTILITDFGVTSPSDSAPFPRTLGFPVIPLDRVEVGETWREFGTRIVEPGLDGRLTRIRFYCEYRYEGVAEYSGDEVYAIRAQYALRYRAGDDRYGDPDLTDVSGSHVARILIYADGSGRVFTQTQIDEAYRYRDGRRVTNQGFLLTWFKTPIALDRAETIRAVKSTLEGEGVRDVRVESSEDGVSITLEKIHFIPDSPEILPDEVGRLDSLYSALAPLSDRSFLVVGHTADVGSVESQLLLSVERAQTVIGGLSERGIPAERFIYSGKGGSEPVAPNDNEEGRARNRRVEIIILD